MSNTKKNDMSEIEDDFMRRADKIHLTEAGYAIVGNTIGAALATII
jgi:hypothetical protein